MTGAPRLIGLKSVSAVALSALLVALAAVRHALDASTLRHQSPGACFLVGVVACLAVALLGVVWRFEVRSRSALALVRGRARLVDPTGGAAPRPAGGAVGVPTPRLASLDPTGGSAPRPAGGAVGVPTPRLASLDRLAEGPRPRELPAMVQRVLLLAGFAGVAIAGLGNHAAARIAQLPDELAAPAPSEYCLPEPAAPAAPAAPTAPPPPVDQPGCALVLRAYKLGYAKTLGACAPRPAAPASPAPAARREVCTRRQLDEPALHYGFRRVAGAAQAVAAVDPAATADHRVTEARTHVDYLDSLLADIRHAITGSPHAAHHLWVDLPDPHPRSPASWFTGRERCSQQFADLPLWPAWQPGDEARLVEHVLGQLLFATRFGTTASCSDYVIHWDAPPDTCRRLAAGPIAVLDRDGALAGIRAVLDRRRRQLEIGALAQALGRTPPVAPPGAGAIASLACFIIDPAAGPARDATGATITVDGDALSLREIHVPAVRTGGDGPIDVYAALALLLAGPGGDLAAAVRPPEPVELAGDDFLLVRLDPLIDADPFRGARAPLGRPELIEVYPFEHHLHGFIDGFRRRYLAQRGRL